MFWSKILQSDVRPESQRKTSVIAIPMQLEAGLGEAGRSLGSPRLCSCLPAAPAVQCHASPESPAPGAGRLEGFPKVSQRFPRVYFFRLWEIEHE